MKAKIIILTIILITTIFATTYLANFFKQNQIDNFDNYIGTELKAKFHQDTQVKFDIITIILIIFQLLLYIITLNMLSIQNRLKDSENTNENNLEIIDKYVITSTTDADGIITDVSQRFCDNIGYTKDELLGKKYNLLRDSNFKEKQYKELYNNVISGKNQISIIENKAKDGNIYWLDTIMLPIFNSKNKTTQCREIGYDITAQKQYHNLAKEIKIVLNATPNIAFIIDGNDIEFCNKAFLNFLGIQSLEEFKNNKQSIGELFLSGEYFNKNDLIDTQKWISKIVESTSKTKLISITSYKDKKEIIFSVEINKLATKNNNFLIILSNITIMKEEVQRHQHQANFDALTYIHNKDYFHNALKHELSLIKRYNYPSSLLIFNIDFFKKIDETYGEIVSDDILVTLAKMIENHIRENDVFARLEMEEFAIVSTHTTINQMQIFAEILRKEVESIHFDKVQNITCSFGIAQANKNDTNSSFLKRAKIALQRANAYGKNRVEVEKII